MTRPANIEELKDRIRDYFAEVTDEMLQKTVLEYRKWLEKEFGNNGGHMASVTFINVMLKLW